MRDIVKLYPQTFKIRSTIVLSICLTVSGCAQPPAPIEFAHRTDTRGAPKKPTVNKEIMSRNIDITQLIPAPVIAEPSLSPAPVPISSIEPDEIKVQQDENIDSILEEIDLLTRHIEPKIPNEPAKKEAFAINDPENLVVSGIPVTGKILDNFGSWVDQKKLTGVNIAASLGAPVKAVFAGTIIYLGEDPIFGKLVVVKQKGGELLAAYAHLANYTAAKNAIIEKGQVIGHVGSTGSATRPMLHIAIRKGSDQLIDPKPYLK